MLGSVLQHLQRALRHRRHIAGWGQVSRFAAADHLGDSAGVAGDHRHGARHRFERRQPERFRRRREDEKVGASQHVAHVFDLSQKAHVFAQAEPIDLMLGEITVGAVAHEHESRGKLFPHAGEDLHHVADALHRPEVRHVHQDAMPLRREAFAIGVVCRREIVGARHEVRNHSHIAVAAAECPIGLVS